MAPSAQIYLATVATVTDLAAAVNWFQSQGVTVISRSLGAELDGPGNGTGSIAAVVNDAINKGMTWVNAAGNHASPSGTSLGSYWRGSFIDADADDWMEFAPGDEVLGFFCGGIQGFRWSDWSGNATDYDIYAIDPQTGSPVASSVRNQTTGAAPIENFGALNCNLYPVLWLAVYRWAAGNGTVGDILEFVGNGTPFEYSQNPYSAAQPASDSANPGMVAVGAIDPASGSTIAPYSSRGPTNDGRVKPDISAPSCVTTVSYGLDCFNGTSAATPVVAGAAALAIGAGVAGSPSSVSSFLRSRVIDRGPGGLDNTFGQGQVHLGSPPGPKGGADGYVVAEGAVLSTPAPGVLVNDVPLPAGVGAMTAVLASNPAHGTLTLNANGSFTYTHNGSELPFDTFTYRPVQDGVQGTATTVTISVSPVNDAPKANNDGPYAVPFLGTLTKSAPGVLANDVDADGDNLTAVVVSLPAHGTLALSANGSLSYTHDGSEATTDSFTYRVKDPSGALSNVATVKLTIGKRVHATGLVNLEEGRWYLHDPVGVLGTNFFFGNPGDLPFMGDWDGDGIETPGLYRQSDGYVYLRNANSQGPADIKFFFGDPGDVPIAGDFNGNGLDTVSIYRPSNQTFYIINQLGANDGGLGAADFSYVFGDPGDKPFVGDFDGDGIETVGLHRESTGFVYFRNSHTQGNADSLFFFGDPDDRLVAGDWNGNGSFSPALYRPSTTTMYFRYTNSQGNADKSFVPLPSNSGWVPVSGFTGY